MGLRQAWAGAGCGERGRERAGGRCGGLWSSQVRKLESQGVPTKQAEAITEVLNDSLDSMSESFVSKADIQKVVLGIAWRAVSYLMV